MKPPVLRLSALLLLLPAVPLSAAPLITEVLSSNDGSSVDEDGDSSDWIEIHNPDAEPVDLAGWRLTDDASRASKWVFPAGVTLPAGEFLRVWASGKDRTADPARLHTNFSLSASGEYLALISPDGTSLPSVFNPLPPMRDDESYGVPFVTKSLVDAGTPASILVPADNAAGETWTQPGFVPGAGWTAGPLHVGFGMLTPGFLVEERQASVDITSISRAESVLNGTSATDRLTDLRQWINIVGSGDDGRFGDGQLPLHGPDPSNIALRATATIVIPADGDWTFHVNSDDGFRLRIDGAQVMQFSGSRGPADSLITRSLTAGEHAISLTYFEATGGDHVELSAAQGAHESFSNLFALIGDTANGGLPALAPPDSGYSPVATDPGSAMIGTNASAFIRIPFEVGADPFDTLDLTVSYNDGFVAWLNGTKIAARNAPDSPAFNATATAQRRALESLVPETIGLSEHRALLVPGTNVLAIQGLNSSAADDSFHVAPRLSGRRRESDSLRFFRVPTPAAANTQTPFLGHVADTAFAPERGYFDAPFQVTLSTATPGAVIRYTTDGSTPSPENGTVYSGPIAVSQTTALRAAAFLEGYDPSPVETHTYLFPADIIRQAPGNGDTPGPGWPRAGTVSGQVINYGMDPDIVNHSNPDIGGPEQTIAALRALPAVCLTTDLPNLFDTATGIYTHAGNHGRTWERPASLEMIGDSGTVEGGFASPCGVRIRGGYSRSGSNPKHAFRIFFRKDYGAGKLHYPIFGDQGADEFDAIDIQCSQNYSWSFEGNTSHNALREIWSRDTQLAMGRPATRGRFVHLYLDGVYWGLYQFQERAEAAYGATYLGGNKDDYDVIKHTGNSGGYTTEATDGYFDSLPDGTDAAWKLMWRASRDCYLIHKDRNPAAPTQTLVSTPEEKLASYFRLSGLMADGVTPNGGPVLLDVDNLIDYIIVLFFTRNTDSGISAFLSNSQPNNFFCIRNRTGSAGFVSFVHDAEHSLNASSAADRWGPWPSANAGYSGNWNNIRYSNPQFVHQDLTPSAEYTMRFADRLYTLLFHGGALTRESNQARLDYRAAQVEPAIVAESARWGDSKSGTPRTASNWRSARNATRAWFNNRSTAFLSQARTRGFYPRTDPPEFALRGGTVAPGFAVTLTNPNPAGTIYFTTDGSDPRKIGAAAGGTAYASPVVLTESATVKTRVLNDTEWSALNEAVFFVGSVPASAANLAISEFSYQPAGPQSEAEAPWVASDFEFIELLNIGDTPVDLYGVSLSLAVDCLIADSPGQVVLAPGARLAVSAHPEAFAARYPGVSPVAGPWTGSLDNAGETIRLTARDGSIVREVRYAPDSPWPGAAAGDGFTAVLTAPYANPDHTIPANWSASDAVHGSPGAGEPPTSGYADWKAANGNPADDADGDGDGLATLAEYALGGAPDTPDPDRLPLAGQAEFTVGQSTAGYLTLRFTRRASVADVAFAVESSESAEDGWLPAGVVSAGESANEDGTITVVCRSAAPVTPGERRFLRLRLRLLDP